MVLLSWVLPLLAALVLLPWRLLRSSRRRSGTAKKWQPVVVVVALGDLQQSPRIVNQATSLAQAAAWLNVHSRAHSTSTSGASSADDLFSPTVSSPASGSGTTTGFASSTSRQRQCLRRRKKQAIWANQARWRTVLVGHTNKTAAAAGKTPQSPLSGGNTPYDEPVHTLSIQTFESFLTRHKWLSSRLLPARRNNSYVTYAILKSLFGTQALLRALWGLGKDVTAVMVQNPPSIPTLPLVWLFCHLRGAAFIIDWHNTGHSLLRLSPRKAALAPYYESVESFFGRRAHLNFTVTAAMKKELVRNWGFDPLRIFVLPDAPVAQFRPLCLPERHALAFKYLISLDDAEGAASNKSTTVAKRSLLTGVRPLDCRLPEGRGAAGDQADVWPPLFRRGVDKTGRCTSVQLVRDALKLEREQPMVVRLAAPLSPSWQAEETPITVTSRRGDVEVDVRLKTISRPAILITSTSYTDDEKLDWLVSALKIYDDVAQTKKQLPTIFLIITGRGPNRDKILQEIEEANYARVQVISVFVPYSDYPALVGLADLFISLHASSSGVDYPMKLVDAKGAGVPALGIDYAAMHDTGDDVSGGVLLFKDHSELADLLCSLLEDFPCAESRLTEMQVAALADRPLPWNAVWRQVALPALQSTVLSAAQ